MWRRKSRIENRKTQKALTSRAGLLVIAQLMESLRLGERIDKHFPRPGSNRGYSPSEFIKALILMQHEGSFHLGDIRHVQGRRGSGHDIESEPTPQGDETR